MKKHKVKSEPGGVNLSLIVTPFLDMSFQILAFFIMTYHPSHFEGHIDGNLLPPQTPATKGPKDSKDDDLIPTEIEPILQDVLMISIKTTDDVVKKTTDGEPRMILMKRHEAPESTPVTVRGDTWENAKKKLKDELAKILKESGGDKAAKANIKLDGDFDLKHQYMMEAYDVCKLAGYGKISFVSPGMERKKD